MKNEEATAAVSRPVPPLVQVGFIPGLDRLVPGTHDPRQLIRSKRFGTWKLPVRFHGRDVALISNGALYGR